MLKTLSVSELSTYITRIFEAEELLQDIKVYGEVSGLSCVRGNLYFTLKDESAIIPCIMFGTVAGVKEGDQVVASGSMKYYGKGGKLNFYCKSLVPYGSGALYQKFLELKNKLELEGLFSVKSKLDLPNEIKTIGVITSKTGAVLHDIDTVSHRRNPFLNIVVYPARVQGDGAENTIIDGLRCLDERKDVDVIIIARGGGSIEDLQPFNSEILAREIAKTKKPVISAVGHETDFTICDFVSSLRAATPSEAAELVASKVFEKLDLIRDRINKIEFLVNNLVMDKYEFVDGMIEKIDFFAKSNLSTKSLKLLTTISKLQNISNFSNFFEKKIELLDNKLKLLNPKSMLSKGWVKVKSEKKYLSSVKDTKIDDKIFIEFFDGTLKTNVEEILKGEEK